MNAVTKQGVNDQAGYSHTIGRMEPAHMRAGNGSNVCEHHEIQEESTRSAWVQRASSDMARFKNGLSLYIVNHFLEYGSVLFMGPGTTNNMLARRIFDHQIERNDPLDLVILTNNLTIFALGADMEKKYPGLLSTTQIISTGGTYQQSINSVVGRFTASAVTSSTLRPHLVVLGAIGVSFGEPEGALTYHFEDEIEAQYAFATCATDMRLLVCDHSKLQETRRWQACTCRDLLRNTDHCIIVTSKPDGESSDEERANFDRAIQSFRTMLTRFQPANRKAKVARLSMHIIDTAGSAVDEISAEVQVPVS